ncbi:hypothetical protein K2F54_06795 [Cryobacterium sp. 1639]|uniref:hypothetical protein n=1 Tax=Cryobacterium inferilacus TaxID=2866629 RepID=UPI001C72CC24|nr:hypothetical protein [Cryobacterium sp. 1639]MBX0299680.1 hypothetical protein [Cryobacterium sp. 1639]
MSLGIAAWIAVVSLIVLFLVVTLFTAAINATILVDQVPGGDAGLATTPALDTAYRTISWSFPALIGVVTIGVVVPLIVNFRRRK